MLYLVLYYAATLVLLSLLLSQYECAVGNVGVYGDVMEC